jgi:hypothetical protein
LGSRGGQSSGGFGGGFFVLTLSASQDSTLTVSAAVLRGESALDGSRRAGGGGIGATAASTAASAANGGGDQDAEGADTAPRRADGPGAAVPEGQGGGSVSPATVFGVCGDVARLLAEHAADLLADVGQALASQARPIPADLMARLLALGSRTEHVARAFPLPAAVASVAVNDTHPLPPLPPWSQIVATIPPAFSKGTADLEADAEGVLGPASLPWVVGTAVVLAGSGALLAHRRRWF